ncbi:CU044_5270 family protein [Umezawaea sp. NPDC059074]|uniref:CU044_5270 family protein n=1 Tax=Umezawaea sp. NPDC059074 TaxID=3346716 RepID=UPI00368011EA
MDDLTLVRDLFDDTPLPDAAALAPARARVMATISAPAPVRLLRHRSRFALVGGTTVGLAAAVAAAITLVPRTTPPVEQGTDAVQVLRLAANHVLAQPRSAPRPDQFVYAKSDGRESWRSVDGTQDGVLITDGSTTPLPGCRDGRAAVVKGDEILPGVTEPCEPRPAYRSDLPTTTDAMLAYLDANASGDPGNVNARGKDVLALIGESAMPAETRAALFEAASRIPGLQVVPDVHDATGKPGIGITWPPPADPSPSASVPASAAASASARPKPTPIVLVFDATTYEYLGTPQNATTVVSIVDQPGQRP